MPKTQQRNPITGAVLNPRIINVSQEGRNGTIVRLWLDSGDQIDLRPVDPDREFFANLAVKLIRAK